MCFKVCFIFCFIPLCCTFLFFVVVDFTVFIGFYLVLFHYHSVSLHLYCILFCDAPFLIIKSFHRFRSVCCWETVRCFLISRRVRPWLWLVSITPLCTALTKIAIDHLLKNKKLHFSSCSLDSWLLGMIFDCVSCSLIPYLQSLKITWWSEQTVSC